MVGLDLGGMEGSAGVIFEDGEGTPGDLVLVLLGSVILVDLTSRAFTQTFFFELASNCLFIESNKSENDFEALLCLQLLHGSGEHFASETGVRLPEELAFSLLRF